MRRLQDFDRNEEHKPDTIDVLINVCRIGAFIFALIAVYLISIKQQAVLWPVIAAVILLIAGVVLGNVPQKIDTVDGKKDKKNW